MNNTTATGVCSFGIFDDPNYIFAAQTNYMVPTRMMNFQGQLIAKEGQQFFGAFGSCVLHDDIYFRLTGYKMKVA